MTEKRGGYAGSDPASSPKPPRGRAPDVDGPAHSQDCIPADAVRETLRQENLEYLAHLASRRDGGYAAESYIRGVRDSLIAQARPCDREAEVAQLRYEVEALREEKGLCPMCRSEDRGTRNPIGNHAGEDEEPDYEWCRDRWHEPFYFDPPIAGQEARTALAEEGK